LYEPFMVNNPSRVKQRTTAYILVCVYPAPRFGTGTGSTDMGQRWPLTRTLPPSWESIAETGSHFFSFRGNLTLTLNAEDVNVDPCVTQTGVSGKHPRASPL